MPAPGSQSCANCQYVVVVQTQYAGGERDISYCHESPPVVVGPTTAQWPTVQPTDWCGHWKLAGAP